MELDKNLDNNLDIVEIDISYKNTLRLNQIDNFFKKFDTDRDGLISLYEYITIKKN
jgi:hypothetical protein